MEPTFGGAEELLERFLAGRADRTRQAYTTDLEDFARFCGRAPAEAVTQLLADPAQGRRMVLEYAVELRQRGLAQATIDRRLSTLRSLVRMASALGVVGWSLEIPDADQLAAATERRSDDVYVLPRHPSEQDRLDVQHYAMREALQRNHLAPIDTPAAILDVGCGTGQWAFELCVEHPGAMVVGLDLVPGKPAPVPNYRLVRGNVVQGLPFGEGRFDFVHQRLLQAGVPLKSWSGVVNELVRVTRAGGWIELVEVEGEVQGGPATRRLLELLLQLAGSRGLDGTGVLFRQLDEYLRRAGLGEVQRRDVNVPIGDRGGRIGSLMASDLRALYTRLADVFPTLGVSADECRDLVSEMSRELNEYQTSQTFGVAFGRKLI
jgi:SAM-dependent methyltransferase